MKELKALEILKDVKKRAGVCTMSIIAHLDISEVKYAIAELEALQSPKTCDGCEHERMSSQLYIYCIGCNRMKVLVDRFSDKNEPQRG